MKKLIFLTAVIISLVSCSSPEDKKHSENLAVARQYMEAVENLDAATVEALLADNYMGYGPSVGDSITKEVAVSNFKYNAENLYESFKYTRHQEVAVTVKEGAAAGDWVLNWAYLTIKYKDGRGPINLWVNVVYRFEDGKIMHSRTFYNEADA
ncbi:MAG TPA: nuclear transport factor 2 family protein, partial [Bacteroidales bacterium]|nr:nuclear transport factor 2 family protein [Bacteroidales bacterium]